MEVAFVPLKKERTYKNQERVIVHFADKNVLMTIGDLDNFMESEFEQLYVNSYDYIDPEADVDPKTSLLHYFLDVTEEYFKYFENGDVLCLPEERTTKEEFITFLHILSINLYSKTRLPGFEESVLETLIAALPMKDLSELFETYSFMNDIISKSKLLRKIYEKKKAGSSGKKKKTSKTKDNVKEH